MALQEVDGLLRALHDRDQRVRQVLLGVRLDPLDPALVLEHDGAVALHLVLAGEHRLPVRVDVVDGDAARLVGVLVQPVPVAGEVGLAGEDPDAHRSGEGVEHPPGLVRQRVLPPRGQVPAQVLAREHVVQGDDDGRHQDDAGAGEGPVAGLPPRERPADLAPVAGAVQQDAREAGEGQRPAQRLQVGRDQPREHRREDEQRARPAEETEDSVQHRGRGLSRSSAPGPSTSRSGTGRPR